VAGNDAIQINTKAQASPARSGFMISSAPHRLGLKG
jgi:hypothetical protein